MRGDGWIQRIQSYALMILGLLFIVLALGAVCFLALARQQGAMTGAPVTIPHHNALHLAGAACVRRDLRCR